MQLKYYLLLGLTALLVSCSAPKEVLYLQDITSLKEEVIDKNYEVIIHKDDLLAILVNSKDPELALPFNMPLVTYQIGAQSFQQGYSITGNIKCTRPSHFTHHRYFKVQELNSDNRIFYQILTDEFLFNQFGNLHTGQSLHMESA